MNKTKIKRKITSLKNLKKNTIHTVHHMKMEKELIRTIISIRKAQKYSQKTLAEAMAITQPEIARWEKCTVFPSFKSFFKLLHVLGFRIVLVPVQKI